MAGDRERREGRRESEAGPRSAKTSGDSGLGLRREQVPTEIRDVSFPAAVRGYERRAVDAYVERVNGVIADLEVGRSPQSAIKNALDRVGQQTSGVLQRAREAAEEITTTALAEAEEATSRARAEAEQTIEDAKMQAHQVRGRSKVEADEILARASAEAAEQLRESEQQARMVQEQAEARLRELQADTEAVWEARRKVLEDLPRIATELMEVAGGAAARLQRPRSDGSAPARRAQSQPEKLQSEKTRPEKAAAKKVAAPDAGRVSSTPA